MESFQEILKTQTVSVHGESSNLKMETKYDKAKSAYSGKYYSLPQ